MTSPILDRRIVFHLREAEVELILRALRKCADPGELTGMGHERRYSPSELAFQERMREVAYQMERTLVAALQERERSE